MGLQSSFGNGSMLTVAGVVLILSLSVRSLGVLLDPSLLLDVQVAAVAKGAYFQLRRVRQLQPLLEKKDLAIEIHALVRSRLDYCNMHYVGLPLKTTQKLHLVQDAAAWMHDSRFH